MNTSKFVKWKSSPRKTTSWYGGFPTGAAAQTGRYSHRKCPNRKSELFHMVISRKPKYRKSIELAHRRVQAGASTKHDLSSFLQWLMANGVEGIEDGQSSISLFESSHGNRGIIATKDISRGSQLLKVPLKLAIVDNGFEDVGTQELLPWNIRLACKLLCMIAEGDSSPWKPYLDTLPDRVYSPTSGFSWKSIQDISYWEAREQIDFSSWMISAHWNNLPKGSVPEATTLDEFERALSLVHSRTFSLPSKQSIGGVIRFLVPLVDMFNHAGDVDVYFSGGHRTPGEEIVACDACRWDCISNIGGDQIMVVSAVRDILAGEEVTLSYGERSNDDFFLYYGFVPPRNPHDIVALFKDKAEAIEWAMMTTSEEHSMDLEEMSILLQKALKSIEDNNNELSSSIDRMEEMDSMKLQKEHDLIKLQSGGRVDERLLLVLETLYCCIEESLKTEKDIFIREMVATRAAELLQQMHQRSGVSLLSDLKSLAEWEMADGHVDPADLSMHQFGLIFEKYRNRIEDSKWHQVVQQDAAEQQAVGIMKSEFFGSFLNDFIPNEFDQYQSPITRSKGLLEKENNLGEENGENVSHSDQVQVKSYLAYKCLILWDACLL